LETDGKSKVTTPLEALREKAIEAYDAAKAEAEKQSKPTTQSSYLSGLSVAYHVALKMWEAALSQPDSPAPLEAKGRHLANKKTQTRTKTKCPACNQWIVHQRMQEHLRKKHGS
jgi:hypothetical protein